MLMTESEEKKFRRAKDSYTRIQAIVARGGSTLPFYKDDPSVLPANYRPVCRKERLTIGTFLKPSNAKKRGKIVRPDGVLIEDVAQEFLASFFDSNGLPYDNMQAVFDTYYPKSDVRERALKYLPKNTHLGPTHRVGHSTRTVRFVKHIAKMENRILYDGRSDAGDDISDILPGTREQLLLPLRSRPAPATPDFPAVSPFAPDTLFIPDRLKRRLQHAGEERREEEQQLMNGNRNQVSTSPQRQSASPIAQDISVVPQGMPPESLEVVSNIESIMQSGGASSAVRVQEQSTRQEEPAAPEETADDVNADALSFGSSISIDDLDEYIRANGGQDILRIFEDEQAEEHHETHLSTATTSHPSTRQDCVFDFDDHIAPMYPFERKVARPKNSAFPIASFMASVPKFNDVAEKMVRERELRISGRSTSVQRILDMFLQRASTPTFSDDFDPDALDALAIASENTASNNIPTLNDVNSNECIPANQNQMQPEAGSCSQSNEANINVYIDQESHRQQQHLEDVYISHRSQLTQQHVNIQHDANQQQQQQGVVDVDAMQATSEAVPNDQEEMVEPDLSFVENKLGEEQYYTAGEEEEEEEERSPILPPSSPPIMDGWSPSRAIQLSAPSSPASESPQLRSFSDPRSSSPFRPRFRANAAKTSLTDLASQPVTAPARLRRARRTFDHMQSEDEDETHDEEEEEMPVRKRQKTNTAGRNPFLDLEAEESTDDEEASQPRRTRPREEEEEEDEEKEDVEAMDSFIYDGSSDLVPDQQTSSQLEEAQTDSGKHFDIYRASLLAPEVLQSRGMAPVFQGNNAHGRKSWLDKVRTDVWIQAAEEDDSIVDDDYEEEEDSRPAYVSEIKEFNSDSDFASG